MERIWQNESNVSLFDNSSKSIQSKSSNDLHDPSDLSLRVRKADFNQMNNTSW